MHFVLLFHTYSISCSTALFVLVKLKMILLCHTHVQQHTQMHSYRTTFRYGGKFKDGWENRYKLRCSQVLFAYTVSCVYVYVYRCCRISEREENLLIIHRVEYYPYRIVVNARRLSDGTSPASMNVVDSTFLLTHNQNFLIVPHRYTCFFIKKSKWDICFSLCKKLFLIVIFQ